MKIFPLFPNKKKTAKTPIGISENAEWRCFVWFADNQPQSYWQNAAEPIPAGLTQLQAVKFSQNFVLIRPIPADYIWRKTAVLPFIPPAHALYPQLMQILKQELPLPLEAVYFDFVIEELSAKQQIKLHLFALRKSFADPLMLSPSTILDCERHCYERALAYLNLARAEPVELPSQIIKSTEIKDTDLYLTALGACLWKATTSI